MTEPVKPEAIRRAVALLWFSLGTAFVAICSWIYFSEFPIHIGTILTTSRTWLGFIVSALLVHGISTRKNWARIIFTISLAVDVLMTALNVILETSRFQFLVFLDVALVLVQLYATYLLFTRASNYWFKHPTVAA